MNKPNRKAFRFLNTVPVLFLLVLTVIGASLFFDWNKTQAQTKTPSKKKTTVNKANPDIFKEQTFEGKKVKPVIQATTTFAEILEFEKNEYVPPEMDYVLNSKGGRPKNPPAKEMPAPPSSIFKQNPKMFFDYEKFSKTNSFAPAVASPTPDDDFTALPDGLTSIPPDTHGAVGPNHLMTALNTQVRIQNKTGGITSTVTLNSFFSSVGGGGGTFDPRVLYDQMSNRWIVVAVDDSFAASSKVLIAVSQTTDPTGTWNFYGYDHDGTDVDWADYPMVGYNKDWIAIGINDFTLAGGFGGAQMYIFDKSTLYSGAVTPTVLQHDIGTSFGNVHQPAETFDSSLDTIYVLQRWSSAGGSVRIYTITGTAASPIFTATSLFPSTTPWNGSVVAAPQSGSAVTITNNDTRMQSVVYRNGSLWATHSIGMPTGTATRTSVQWWQITPTTGTTVQAGKIDDATGTNFYAFPSIAVNAANQVLIGYSAFSGTTFASAAYSYRGVTDASTTTQDPIRYKAGVGCYNKTFSGSTNRFGDYSRVAVDPTDDSTFWALQEFADAPSGTPCAANSGRWGTWWAKLIPPCTGIVASGNWNVTGTWGCGNVPTVTDDAVIATGQNVTLNVNPIAASITINTGGTLSMSGNRTSPVDIELNGTLNLTGGILDMGANTLKVGCGGAVTGASATGYVLGNVEKEYCATGSFTYPVGENGYSPMTANVTALATNPTTLTVDAIDSVLTGIAPISSASRQWDLAGTGLTADLSFTYLDADVNGNESNYRVFRKIGAATPTDQCGVPCVNVGTNTATVTGQSSFSNWGVGALAPTAAGTTVGGKVFSSNGRGLGNAIVILTKSNGETLTARTNQFGYYRFIDIEVGQTYIFNVSRKGYSFATQAVTIDDQLTDLNFTASP